MTIITKPFGEKKSSEKLSVPLVLPSVPAASAPRPVVKKSAGTIENGNHAIIRQERLRRSAISLLLLLTALLVMCMGIISGVVLYRQYANSRVQRMRFHGFCGIPYDAAGIDNKAMLSMNEKWRSIDFGQDETDILKPLVASMQNMLKSSDDDDDDDNDDEINNHFFREEFDLDLSDDESYSKIDVPDFHDGRRGKFLHDFKFNQTAICDKQYKRCFVMDLDRESVLPPRSMFDLITKMWQGYYNIDTDVIRQNMRVITPALTNYDSISPTIVAECERMNIYKLEKMIGGVYKRSVDLHENAKFAEFGGKNIVMIDIHGMENIKDNE